MIQSDLMTAGAEASLRHVNPLVVPPISTGLSAAHFIAFWRHLALHFVYAQATGAPLCCVLKTKRELEKSAVGDNEDDSDVDLNRTIALGFKYAVAANN